MKYFVPDPYSFNNTALSEIYKSLTPTQKAGVLGLLIISFFGLICWGACTSIYYYCTAKNNSPLPETNIDRSIQAVPYPTTEGIQMAPLLPPLARDI